MATETDSHGRLYLPADIRDKYGEKFHIVEYRDRLELIPVEEDALEAARTAAGSPSEAETANGEGS